MGLAAGDPVRVHSDCESSTWPAIVEIQVTLLVASEDGVAWDAPYEDRFQAARPGGYDVYWCRGSCRLDDFVTRVGRLELQGPEGAQEFNCTRGDVCVLSGVQGVELEAGDEVRVQLTCGTGDTVAGIPGDG